jgi:hypothetical protein
MSSGTPIELDATVERCLTDANDADAGVRSAGLARLAELARARAALPIGHVVPTVVSARQDPDEAVRAQAEETFADLEAFVLDPPRVEHDEMAIDDETVDLPAMTVAAAIRRSMRRTAHFVVTRGPLRRDEWRVGWYFNPPPSTTRLLFTTAALHVLSDEGAWRLDWSAIESTDEDTDGVHVGTADGKRFIPVTGRHGDRGVSPDVFLLVTVLGILKPR